MVHIMMNKRIKSLFHNCRKMLRILLNMLPILSKVWYFRYGNKFIIVITYDYMWTMKTIKMID